MVVRTSLWWSEHNYGDHIIIMVVRTSLWWSEHHYGGQSTIMVAQNIMMIRASVRVGVITNKWNTSQIKKE